MKTRSLITVVLSILMLTGFTAKAQEENQSYDDKVLDKIANAIPKNWMMVKGNLKIFFVCTDSVYILRENRINAPVETKEEREKRILANGYKGTTKLIYRYESRWSEERIRKVKAENFKVAEQLKALPSKHNVTELHDPARSSKNKKVYTGNTPAEKARVKAFEDEEEQLRSLLVTIPNYSTEKYSLFIVSRTGCNDDFHVVYPEKTSNQLYKIEVLIRELCQMQ